MTDKLRNHPHHHGMPTHFGMPTLLDVPTPEDCCALCKSLGLDFIELNMNLPYYQTDKLDIARLLAAAEAHGVYYTLHLDENLNPCDFNPLVARAYTETTLLAIEIAKRLRVPVITMHPLLGVHFTLPGRRAYLFDTYEDEYRTKLTAFRDACATAIGNADITICVENGGSYGHAPFVVRGLDLLLEAPAFALTFDTGHSAAANFTDEPTILSRIHRLRHMHLHDARGRDHHLPLGDGNLDLAAYLDMAKEHNCRVVLEVKTSDGLRRSADWLRERGYL